MIHVHIGRLNSEAIGKSLENGSTISDLLREAKLNRKDSEVITVNSEEITDDPSDYELEDGDRVLLVRNVEGSGM